MILVLDLGDQITLTYPSKPTSPASVTVTIGLPDGTATTPTAAMSGSYTYTPSQVGRHTVLWVAAGPADSYSDSFDVADPASATIISLADAKAQLRVTQSTNDEELRLYLASVTALVEHEVGVVVPTEHVEVVEASDTIILAKSPVMSLTSVVPTFPIAGAGVFGVPSYTLDGPAGMLRQQPFTFADWGFDYGPAAGSFSYYRGRLTVTYVAGRPVVPAALQTAARIILAELWTTRRLAGPKPAGGGEQEQQYGREMIPPEAVALIAPYRRAPRVA